MRHYLDIDAVNGASVILFEFHGANFSRSNIPGIAIRVQDIKKDSQPRFFARKPVGAEASTLGTPIRLVRSAYCVAVNLLFVILAMNAAYAAVPMPLLRFSKAITPDRAGTLWPIRARSAKHAVDMA
jgi:hypothetical protein